MEMHDRNIKGKKKRMRTQDYYDNKRNNYDTSHNIGDRICISLFTVKLH